MTKRIEVICPYCGFKDSLYLEEGLHTLLCDPEEGGCDEYYVIDVKFIASYDVYTLEKVVK